MAISAVHYTLLKEHAPLLKRGGSLLEIGEANWYGDMDPCEIVRDLEVDCPYATAVVSESEIDLFEVAKAVYTVLFAPNIYDSVDMNGTERALKQDLNGPLSLPRLYDVAINHGTAEHIFNIAMVFKSMHDWTKTGGIMIHESPFTGWVDHGFYCLQPTLFYDLAAENEYELISLSITEIEGCKISRVASRENFHDIAGDLDKVFKNSMLFVVLRKTVDAPFRVPMQGVYGGKLSEKGKEAWQLSR